MVVLMHADPSALLPSAKDLGKIPQMHSDHIVTKKRIRIDPAIRAERKTWPNTKFARDGFGSLPITFAESDRLLLEDLMQEAAKSKGCRSRIEYLDGGRVGYIISLARAQASAFGGAMRRTLSGGILDSVAFYMGGYAKVFSIEFIEITPGAPIQDVHSDIRDTSGRCATERLVVTAIISTLGAVTTEVFPNSRSPDTWKRVFADHEPGIRATEVDNCVLFDACLAHRGMGNASSQSIFRLCVTFIQACASPAQISFVEKSLARKSLNMSVHELGLGGAGRAAAEEEGCRLRRRL